MVIELHHEAIRTLTADMMLNSKGYLVEYREIFDTALTLDPIHLIPSFRHMTLDHRVRASGKMAESLEQLVGACGDESRSDDGFDEPRVRRDFGHQVSASIYE